MSAVTLPGTLPGLLRRGAPVVVLDVSEETTGCDGSRLRVGDCATLTDGPTDSARRWCISTGTTVNGEGPPWSELPASALALDLSDHVACDIAARWGANTEIARAGDEAYRDSSIVPGILRKWHALRDDPSALAACVLAVAGDAR